MDFLDQLQNAENSFKKKEAQKGKQYTIKTQQYCGLSREPKFQQWLEKFAPDLLASLHEHLKTKSGCKENKNKMIVIQKTLESRNLSKELVLFLLDEYPSTVD